MYTLRNWPSCPNNKASPLYSVHCDEHLVVNCGLLFDLVYVTSTVVTGDIDYIR